MDVDFEWPQFEQTLERAKAGSIDDLHQVIDEIKEQYVEHGQGILDAIIGHLAIPDDLEVTNLQLLTALSALQGLTKVAQCYKTGTTSTVDPDALISYPLADRYHTIDFILNLFRVPTFRYDRFPSSLKPSLVDIIIAFWAIHINGHPPIYAGGRNTNGRLDDMDPATRFCSVHMEHEAEAVIARLMSASSICSPRLFVQRTIGRMQALGNVRAIPYLSYLPPLTIEVSNMMAVHTITEQLRTTSQAMERLFAEEGSAREYTKVITSLAERTEAILQEGSYGWNTPAQKQKGADFIYVYLTTAMYICSAVVDVATVHVLDQMKDSISNGALRLHALSEARPPSPRIAEGSPRTMLDYATFFCPYLEVFPSVYEDVMKYIAPRVPEITAIGIQFRMSDMTLEMAGNAYDVETMKMMSNYLDKENRVRLCDNLKHLERHNPLDASSNPNQEQQCSRCHSVVYCSVKCQQEDWSAFHKHECKHMAKDYADKESRGSVYSYHNRSFQTSFIRHAYESYVATIEAGPTGLEIPDVPGYLRPRFNAFVKEFVDVNGDYQGSDPERIRAQDRHLVARPFNFGDKDVHLLILLKRVGFTRVAVDGTHQHMRRGPKARSDFLVQGVLSYMGPPKQWTTNRAIPEEGIRLGHILAYVLSCRLKSPQSQAQITQWTPWMQSRFKRYVVAKLVRSEVGGSEPNHPLGQTLARAKEGSVSHLQQLASQVRRKYQEHTQEIIDVVCANLAIPQDTQVSDSQFNSAVSALHVLTNIAQWYSIDADPPIHPSILLSDVLAERYIFWALTLLGAPTSSTSELSIHSSQGQSVLPAYHFVAVFFHELLDVPSVTYTSFSPAVRPALLRIIIAMWVIVIDGDPPIYAGGRSQESYNNDDDLVHSLLNKFSRTYSGALAEAVMSGEICPPRLFVLRTIGRMRALGNLNSLRHLLHLPDITIEITNTIAILGVTDCMARADQRLERIFAEEKHTGVYTEVLTSQAVRLDRILRDGTDELWTTPGLSEHAAGYLFGWLSAAVYVISGVIGTATQSILQQMEASMSKGAIRLLSISEANPSSTHTSMGMPWTMMDFATMAAPYLEVFPAVYENVKMYIAPHVPNYADIAAGLRPEAYRNAHTLGRVLDLEMMKIMSDFLGKDNRVQLCDNMKPLGSITITLRALSALTLEFNKNKRARGVIRSRIARRNVSRKTGPLSIVQNTTKQTETCIPIITEPSKPASYATHTNLKFPRSTPHQMAFPAATAGTPHLQPRFDAFIREFTQVNGDYKGLDRARVRTQNRRLIARPFSFGDRDLNLLILLKRINLPDVTPAATITHSRRGVKAKSDFVVQGMMSYMSDPRSWTKDREIPEVVRQQLLIAPATVSVRPVTVAYHALKDRGPVGSHLRDSILTDTVISLRSLQYASEYWRTSSSVVLQTPADEVSLFLAKTQSYYFASHPLSSSPASQSRLQSAMEEGLMIAFFDVQALGMVSLWSCIVFPRDLLMRYSGLQGRESRYHLGASIYEVCEWRVTCPILRCTGPLLYRAFASPHLIPHHASAIDQLLPFLEDPEGIDQLPLQEILARAREFSPHHVGELVSRVKGAYSEAGQDILDTIGTILEIPKDIQGFDPNLLHTNAVINGYFALIEVVQWYIRGDGFSTISPMILISEPLARKYIFWSLLFLGIPATATSPNPPLQCLLPDLQLRLYQHVPSFINYLLAVPGITYQIFPASLKPAFINVCIAWWVALFDGHPPIYPTGRTDPNPEVNCPDLSVALFLMTANKDPQGFAAAIQSGGICPPEVFVKRTIGRMRAYLNIGVQKHLSHFPPFTIEIDNMSSVAQVTYLLIKTDRRLWELFMNEGASGAYLGAYAAVGRELETRAMAGDAQSTRTPESIHLEHLLTLAHQIVEWTSYSPSSVLRNMADVASNGIVQLVSSGRALRADERRGPLDEAFDVMTLYAQFLDVFPSIYEDTIKFFEPLAIDLRPFVGGNIDPDTYASSRNTNFSLDVAGLKIMRQFVEKESRVRLCDNLKHYDKMAEPCESKSQAENGCSRCHSVVYCSAECQMEDWRAFHRLECAKMAKDYQDRKNRDQIYSYHDRAFQASFMRYQYESLAVQRDLGSIQYAHGRDGIVIVDVLRPFCTLPLPAAPFLQSYLPQVPSHILPRMKEFIAAFSSSNGSYRGDDPSQIRRQNIRLLFRSFPFGSDDIHLFLLLKRGQYVEFDGPDYERMEKMHDFKFRGPQANSDYVVKGCLTYMAQPRGHTRTKQPAPSIADFNV
ncbi:hypothetical protein NMY22_g10332 [Coprinellus aureogranulatus]|nr:hypothetical protein NMY22_g10332 [Coprinellus aureogranulatus]